MLSTNEPESRRFFTLAHELGHIELGLLDEDCQRDERVERLCDKFAAELLLPTRLTKKLFKEHGSLGVAVALKKIVEFSELSAEVAITRLSDCGVMRASRAQIILYSPRERKIVSWARDGLCYSDDRHSELVVWLTGLMKGGQLDCTEAPYEDLRYTSQGGYSFPVRRQAVRISHGSLVAIGESPLSWFR
ncbi:MAG: ImmA/IrrE family metallo-endopeptidase [Dehalococcoidia bacterium]|nr:ImmA/IrrE family metallo-endopeptidase [Dehalococcoidia bacterium]